MIVTAANDIGTTMMALSGLSYLGIGIVPPTPEYMEICRKEKPKLVEVETGHMIACHLYK